MNEYMRHLKTGFHFRIALNSREYMLQVHAKASDNKDPTGWKKGTRVMW